MAYAFEVQHACDIKDKNRLPGITSDPVDAIQDPWERFLSGISVRGKALLHAFTYIRM